MPVYGRVVILPFLKMPQTQFVIGAYGAWGAGMLQDVMALPAPDVVKRLQTVGIQTLFIQVDKLVGIHVGDIDYFIHIFKKIIDSLHATAHICLVGHAFSGPCGLRGRDRQAGCPQSFLSGCVPGSGLYIAGAVKGK